MGTFSGFCTQNLGIPSECGVFHLGHVHEIKRRGQKTSPFYLAERVGFRTPVLRLVGAFSSSCTQNLGIPSECGVFHLGHVHEIKKERSKDLSFLFVKVKPRVRRVVQ